MKNTYVSPVSGSEDFKIAEEQLYPLVSSPEAIPVRYTLDGVQYRGLPSDAVCTKQKTDAGTQLVYTAECAGVTLRADCVRYRCFGAAEWKLSLTVTGDKPVHISELLGMDLHLTGGVSRVQTGNGDFQSFEGYQTSETRLNCGSVIEQQPTGGRPCDSAFPYIRMRLGETGFNLAIGWPGQWKCRMEGEKKGLYLTAGQAYFDAIVNPGETVRTPLILIVAFAGSYTRGINVWRRFYLKHIMPQYKGKPIPTFLHSSMKKQGTMEYQETTEEEQLYGIKYQKKELGMPLNLWWIDAGWYDCGDGNWWTHAGSWVPDEKRFPNGLGPVGEACAKEGMQFLVWFEPERTTELMAEKLGIDREHPGWLLRQTPDCLTVRKYPELAYVKPDRITECLLFNLGNPECREYITKKIGDQLEAAHATVFRSDFNLEPLPLWIAGDTDDRLGMTENLYIQGYLKYWDDLRTRFPDLIIDSCASGGRRNDLETMRRAVPMHESDACYGDHPSLLSFFHTLYTWIPYFRGFNANWESETGEYKKLQYYSVCETPIDTFQLYQNFVPMINMRRMVHYMEDHPDDTDRLEILRRVCDNFLRISPILETADFYALTPYHKSRFEWTCWQFDKPEEHLGCIEVVRANGALQEELTVRPKVSTDGAVYEFRNCETGETIRMSSDELLEKGITFRMPIRSAVFWEYRQV